MTLIAQGWWFDFVDRWGNSASVAGLLISLGVIFLQLKIRQITQESVRKVALVMVSAAVEDLHRQLSMLTEVARQGQWLRAIDWCKNAQHGILRLGGNPHVTKEEENTLRAGADDLTLIIQYIERNKLGESGSRRFERKHSEAIDRLVIQLGHIQARLGQTTWEV